MPESSAAVYIVDDDRAVRDSLAALLNAHAFSTQVYASAEEFLESHDGETGGCLLVDVRMPGMSGLELQRRLAGKSASFPVIMITGHGDIPMAVEAMRAGAVDFLEKPCSEDALLDAVRGALTARSSQGETGVPKAVVAKRLARLTPREREVLDHLVLGEINKVIAHKLDISKRTVEIHRARIKEKMKARGLSDLIRMML